MCNFTTIRLIYKWTIHELHMANDWNKIMLGMKGRLGGFDTGITQLFGT